MEERIIVIGTKENQELIKFVIDMIKKDHGPTEPMEVVYEEDLEFDWRKYVKEEKIIPKFLFIRDEKVDEKWWDRNQKLMRDYYNNFYQLEREVFSTDPYHEIKRVLEGTNLFRPVPWLPEPEMEELVKKFKKKYD
jgi:hypothetical protein